MHTQPCKYTVVVAAGTGTEAVDATGMEVVADIGVKVGLLVLLFVMISRLIWFIFPTVLVPTTLWWLVVLCRQLFLYHTVISGSRLILLGLIWWRLILLGLC